jgi:N-methylhydantoinase A
MTVATTKRDAAGADRRYRVGVDIGGTFTDTVVFDKASGAMHLTKVPSVPANPALGFLDGFDRALRQSGIDVAALDFVGHGTTVATNTIIQEVGARVGLIASEGFSDMLEIAYQTRPDLFDLMYDKPRPLVPRQRALGVPERLDSEGRVLVPLDEAAVAARAIALRDMGAEVIVVAFLHSYRYPRHEQRAAEIIRATCPTMPVVLSSEICPEYREYPRTSTAVVNAALVPRVGRYIADLDGALVERGVTTGLYLMTSAGGITAASVAAERPVQLLESGPAATVLGAAYVSALSGFNDIVVFDMGGTTAKVALVTNGTPRVSDQFEVGHMAVSSDTAGRGRGYPVRTATVEMVEVGAGGGSIAAVDPGGALTVGPESAGADPGPACYGQKGQRPTVTDANVVLNRLNPDYFLGGEKRLDTGLAAAAIERHVGRPMGLGLSDAALTIIEIANARMAAALKMVSIRRGIDPRRYTLVACGGAGPLHAAAIARQAGMQQVLIPPVPGLTAALGLLSTDLKHDFSRNVMQETDTADAATLAGVLASLHDEGAAVLRAQHAAPADMRFVAQADMSYLGQAFQLRIAIPDGPFTAATLAQLAARFHEAHKKAYGFDSGSERTIIVNLRLTAIGQVLRPQLREVERGGPDPRAAAKGAREVRMERGRAPVTCLVYARERLRAGNVIDGPAIVEQMDTTTLLPPRSRTEVDAIGNLVTRI